MEFDEYYDGIVYGVVVLLGFVIVENILYLFVNGLELVLGRVFLFVFSYVLFGVIMGYYLGKVKFFEGKEKMKWMLYFVFVLFILYGIYDYILKIMDYWVFIIILFMIYLWWLVLRKVKKVK